VVAYAVLFLFASMDDYMCASIDLDMIQKC